MSKANNSQQAEEVDLGQLFSIIGNGFNRLFKFIGGVFNHFFLAFVWTILFIKKRIVILSIAGFVGLVIGWFNRRCERSP